MFWAAAARTWSYCGGSDPVKTFLRGAAGASTRAEMPTNLNDLEVGTGVETTTGLKTPPLRWAVMAPAQMASGLLPEAQAEAEKGP
jgi:hypothetical protein